MRDHGVAGSARRSAGLAAAGWAEQICDPYSTHQSARNPVRTSDMARTVDAAAPAFRRQSGMRIERIAARGRLRSRGSGRAATSCWLLRQLASPRGERRMRLPGSRSCQEQRALEGRRSLRRARCGFA